MTMDVWTVSSVDYVPDDDKNIVTNTLGSWRLREDAVCECAEYVMDRCELRPDLRYAIMHDTNHPDVLDIVSAKVGCDKDMLEKAFEYRLLDEDWEVPPEIRKAMREYLCDEIGFETGYQIDTDMESDIGASEWLFIVAKNPLKLEEGLVVKHVSHK